jgi:hypothetical protein
MLVFVGVFKANVENSRIDARIQIRTKMSWIRNTAKNIRISRIHNAAISGTKPQY